MNYVIRVMTPTNAAPVRCNCRWRLNSADRDNEQYRQPGEGHVAKSLDNIVEANITRETGLTQTGHPVIYFGAWWLEKTPRLIF